MRGFNMPSQVKWFNAKKVMVSLQTMRQKDIFLHVSALEESKLRVLKEEQNITYDIKKKINSKLLILKK